MSELSSVQGVSERLAKNILNDYEDDIEKLSQVNPIKLSIGYNGVGMVTANRIKAWAAATVQKTLTPQGASPDAPAYPHPDWPEISDQVEVTEPPRPDTSDQVEVVEGPPPPASTRVQRIRAAVNG